MRFSNLCAPPTSVHIGQYNGHCYPAVHDRPRVHGKFLYKGSQKFWIRGITYGTFRPNEHGDQFPSPDIASQDLAQMALQGFNTIRTYTVPPTWFLELAHQHGISIMVGLPWEQHILFLDEKSRIQSIEARVREGVASCARHPAVLAFAIGNEIPSPIVRWYGRRKIERFLKRLCQIVKSVDPDGLVTYVNYPTTEYLQLPFLDFVCFNVYLESRETLHAYLARLQHIANERPLVLAEIGLDSLRKGQQTQAAVLDWQIRTVGAAGGAGAFIFAWTDEWYRGGYEIEDWDFGLTDRDRQPKPALMAVRQAFQEFPLSPHGIWPKISVVVCTYNGARTIRDCFEALQRLEYPDYEVIVINDGSTDATEGIAKEFPFQVISTSNRGLSHARNTGLHLAAGDIVAYTDDDAYPDPHWLTYLADMFLATSHAGIGGPNLPPPEDGWIAECVANAPGGPVHVLLTDQIAEHIPGCNMAFRKACLESIGGFDPQFRTAGDDVDICWRLQEKGWTLGFHPSALVWHHRRNSIRTYWRQQRGYGRAEALLEKKWPQKYNAAGHPFWQGRLYGRGCTSLPSWHSSRIYQGVWGCAPFQLMYQANPSLVLSVLQMPESNLALGFLAVLSILGIFWMPLLWALPVLLILVGTVIFLAFQNAFHGRFAIPTTFSGRIRSTLVTAGLHLIQPLARLTGRLCSGLTPWRQNISEQLVIPQPRTLTVWSEEWLGQTDRLESIERYLQTQRFLVQRGGDFDRWDLHIKAGLCGGVRTRMAIEEHGAGKQLVRCRVWPRFSLIAMTAICLLGLFSAWSFLDHAWVIGTILGSCSLLLALRMYQEYVFATFSIQKALTQEPVLRTLKQSLEQPADVEDELLLPQSAPILD
jgi:GT2 family glycosyltransferase